MRHIINEISKGKNINENIREYLNQYKQLNNRFAFVRLALNYYTYYQMREDGDIVNTTVGKSSIWSLLKTAN